MSCAVTEATDTLEMRPIQDEDGVLVGKLASTVWGADPDPAYWQWKYSGNGGRLNGYLITDAAGRAVCASGFRQRLMYVHGRHVPSVMIVDMMTHPEFRGRAYIRVGSRVRDLTRTQPTYGFMNEDSRLFYLRFFERQKSLRQDFPIPGYTLPLRPGKMLKKGGGIVKFLEPAIRALVHLRCLSMRDLRCTVTIAGRFDEAFDTLWNELRHEYAVVFNRDSRYLRWRFGKGPHKYYSWTLREGGRLRGFMITMVHTRGDGTRGLVLDWLVSRNRPGDFRTLLARAVDHLTSLKVDRIDTWILDHEAQWRDTARSLLFFRRPSGRFFQLHAQDQVFAGVTYRQEDIFLTMGDADYPGPGVRNGSEEAQ